MPENRAVIGRVSPANRSRITNGTQLLAGVDGRAPAARRFRDLLNGFAADLGGFDSLSLFDKTSLRNCAGMALRLEQMQAAIARGDSGVSTDELIRLAGSLNRILENVIQRHAKAADGPPAGPLTTERLMKRISEISQLDGQRVPLADAAISCAATPAARQDDQEAT